MSINRKGAGYIMGHPEGYAFLKKRVLHLLLSLKSYLTAHPPRLPVVFVQNSNSLPWSKTPPARGPCLPLWPQGLHSPLLRWDPRRWPSHQPLAAPSSWPPHVLCTRCSLPGAGFPGPVFFSPCYTSNPPVPQAASPTNQF